MSYCRSSQPDSDVYVIGTLKHLECFGAGWKLEQEKPVHKKITCNDWGNVDGKLVELETTHQAPEIFCTTSRQEMINHLRSHWKAGHKVPADAIQQLKDEIEEVGDTY